jgi:hypothetical protein
MIKPSSKPDPAQKIGTHSPAHHSVSASLHFMTARCRQEGADASVT